MEKAKFPKFITSEEECKSFLEGFEGNMKGKELKLKEGRRCMVSIDTLSENKQYIMDNCEFPFEIRVSRKSWTMCFYDTLQKDYRVLKFYVV